MPKDKPSQPGLLESPAPFSEEWKQALLARRRQAQMETSNPYHRDHYEQLRSQSTPHD